MTVGKLPPACLNDMQQYMNILVLKSNLRKYFPNIYKIFIFDASEICSTNAGSLRECAEHTDVPQGLACFSLYQAALSEERELETAAASIASAVPRTAKAECSFPARTHTICTARRVRRLRLKERKCGPAPPFYLSALNAKTGLAHWRCSNDECDGLFRTGTRDKLHGFQQPAKLIPRNFELRRKRLPSRWRENRTCATCFVETTFQFSSGMQCQKSHSVRKSSLERPVLRQKLFLKLQVKQSATQS
ncbi:Hypothetical_protein [Hexamita inflata]|uniref:Hypothetical_protein n=1 Tax=Hexamita inflata TaxID=28002 RepID=A0AA86NJZ8_9EUKA|nr:Hypothetical protein HINF_LOCUS9039 [Hexamita inflata]